jgi:hypothetical protein
MGLLEQGAKVKITYIADTSQAKAEIKTLRGVEKKAAQERLAEIEKGNKQIKDQAEGWKNTADKIALVGGAIAVAKLGLDAYAKTGAENAAKVKKITDGVGGAINGLLSGIGSVVVAFGPMLTAAATFVSALAEAVRLMGELSQAATGSVWEIAAKEYKRRTGKDMPEMRTFQQHARQHVYGDAPSAFGDIGAGISGASKFLSGLGRGDSWGPGPTEKFLARLNPGKKSGRADSAAARARAEAQAQGILDGWYQNEEGNINPRFGGSNLDRQAMADTGNLDSAFAAFEKSSTAAATASWNERLTKARGEKSAFLESTFGKPEEFDVYATAFQTLTGAVTSAMNAWIDGSMSAGKAIKLFVADTLKSVAAQMAVEALKHGAYAIGSLAWGDMKGAALHGKSAAMFAAGAAGAAIAAKSLGGSANTPTATAPGAPTSGGSGGGGSSPDRIIVVGDHFAEQTPRARAQTARNLVSRAYAAQEEW